MKPHFESLWSQVSLGITIKNLREKWEWKKLKHRKIGYLFLVLPYYMPTCQQPTLRDSRGDLILVPFPFFPFIIPRIPFPSPTFFFSLKLKLNINVFFEFYFKYKNKES